MEAPPRGSRVRGHFVWGHESRSFTECGGEREGWAINDAGAELVEVYEELTSTPYQPMFVEVRGAWEAAPREGFGAEYGESLRITELLRAENEGFGCRLDLEDVLFVASGNEPFWRLQVREDGVSMRLMDAPGEIEFPTPRLSGQTPHIVFEAEGPGSGINISLERRRCVDTMSGARYAWVATVETAGRQFRGCAAEGI
jgi:putative lipoprotein